MITLIVILALVIIVLPLVCVLVTGAVVLTMCALGVQGKNK